MTGAGGRVLTTVTNYGLYCAEAKTMLEAAGLEVIENPHGRPLTFDELAAVVGDVDAVVAGVDSWDDRVFELAPRLRVIARFGTGVDNIDLAAAGRRAITVTNAKGANANAVAELTIGLMLGLLREVPRLDQVVRRGIWERAMGAELRGRTVGLLGFGDIPQRVARKLAGFDVRVLAFDKYPDLAVAGELGVRFGSLAEVLAASDVVSLHLPSLPDTQRIMNDERFSQMRPGAWFVNTARGALVDEAALGRALSSGRLAGAAVDVYEVEPASSDNPLFALQNIICTPHSAGETGETYAEIGITTAKAVLDVLRGRDPQNRIV
ncbi:MAG: phosphoglycerate dehydrogenase [Propionicimonas sp.]